MYISIIYVYFVIVKNYLTLEICRELFKIANLLKVKRGFNKLLLKVPLSNIADVIRKNPEALDVVWDGVFQYSTNRYPLKRIGMFPKILQVHANTAIAVKHL